MVSRPDTATITEPVTLGPNVIESAGNSEVAQQDSFVGTYRARQQKVARIDDAVPHAVAVYPYG